jgi:pre-rRNA-processing protein TSR4
MVLILQLNAELPEKFPGHDRRLYVFACRRESCRRKEGSIRALRGVRIWGDEATASSAPKAQEPPKKEDTKAKMDGPGLGDALFGGKGLGGGSGANPFSTNANPFSTSSNPFGTPSQNPFSTQIPKEAPKEAKEETTDAQPASLSKTFAETLSLNTTPAGPPPAPEPWPESSAQPQPYPTLYLAEADYETLEPTSTKIPDNARIEEVDAPETVSALDREAFESSMDAAFQKFADRLAQNPDQVIRYEFGGVPLLYSKMDAVGEKLTRSSIPGCPNCGGKRTFEVQLTPNAIAELEADDMSLEGMEWGTVIVGVCERDCVPRQVAKDEAGYLEEWAGVQWEELVKEK